MNVASKKQYQGINVFWLSMVSCDKGYSSNVWGTYKQWTALGGVVPKGAEDVFFWKRIEVDAKDADGNVLKNEDGDVLKKNVWMLKNYKVWNRDQISGLADDAQPAPADDVEFADCLAAEEFVANCGADIRHGGGRAFYSPASDHIQMPNKADFQGTATSTADEAYYSTLLHELVHWTGSNGRIDRTKGKMFGDSDYAFEELVAETGAAILSVLLGVSPEPRKDHAVYLNGWKKAVKDNPKAVFTAFTQANKAVEFLYDKQPQQEQDEAAA
jgi:antirestriction protein ArdC